MFAAPPYNLTPSQVGLTNLPLLVAGLVGAPVSGWMADKVIRSMSKRNNGVYEPEFRLTLMIIGALLSTIGFFGLGSSIAAGAHIAWPLTFISLHSLAIPFATQAAYTYVVDCHPEDANQAFVTIGLVKAILTFLATTSVNGWFEAQGPRTVFWSIGGVNLGICLLTIPMYIFGKKFRALVSAMFASRWTKIIILTIALGCPQDIDQAFKLGTPIDSDVFSLKRKFEICLPGASRYVPSDVTDGHFDSRI
jgi:MFS family permease